MSYHVFSNLGAKLNADTASKLMEGIDDLTWITRPCNCGPSFKVDGQCIYGGKCRVACVVYKATCKCCNQVYIGKLQRYWKTRMQEHFKDVWKMLERSRRSSSNDPQDNTVLILSLDILLLIVLTLLIPDRSENLYMKISN